MLIFSSSFFSAIVKEGLLFSSLSLMKKCFPFSSSSWKMVPFWTINNNGRDRKKKGVQVTKQISLYTKFCNLKWGRQMIWAFYQMCLPSTQSVSPDNSGEHVKNVHIQTYINYCFFQSYLYGQSSKLCSVQPTQIPGSLSTCRGSPGVSVIGDSSISSDTGSHLFKVLMLCENRTNTNRAIYLNKGKQSGVKDCSSFSKPFSCI